MKVRLDINKTLEENAETYFEKAKKLRAKAVGAEEAIKNTKTRLAQEQERATTAEAQANQKTPPTYWYHKYHWSKTRHGHLLVAGTNASSNETLIKHHTEPTDIVFHTDMAGSPFTILKPVPDTPIEQGDLEDAATLTAAHSKAWKKGLASIEVFYVQPEQVTKEAASGEYLTKGSFMIRGNTTYLETPITIDIGVINKEGYNPRVFIGSKESCEAHCTAHTTITPGKTKTSDIAKKLAKTYGGDSNDYIKALPAGGINLH